MVPGDAFASAVDAVLEAAIAPSFARTGYVVRSHLEAWRDLDSYDLTGRVILLTGATSGLGLAAARQLARCGATLVLVSRSAQRLHQTCDMLLAETGNTAISWIECDIGEMAAVRRAAAEFTDRHHRIDVLIHNAGILLHERQVTSGGIEQTVASQVVGPFLLTQLLLDCLKGSAPSRVLFMSSGGMYAAPLEVDRIEMTPATYRGSRQYALAKRAQVSLVALMGRKLEGTGVVVHSLHPGWVDTPGLREGLPGFTRFIAPQLRTPEQGADTLVWLAADPRPLESTGQFWHDRRPRVLHRWFGTRSTDTAFNRHALWAYCESRSGWRSAST